MIVALFVLLVCAPRGFTLFFRSKDQKLIDAAAAGNVSQVQSLLAKGADIQAIDNSEGNSVTPLIAAVKNDHADIVKLLLAKGAIDKEYLSGLSDFNGYTALKVATRSDYANIVELLIEGGVAKGDDDKIGHIMMIAAKHDYNDIVTYLLVHGADINFQDYDSDDDMPATALGEAVKRGDIEEARWLIKKGADVNAKDSTGDTILITLAEKRGYYCSRDFIAKGWGEAKRLYQMQTLESMGKGDVGGAKRLCKANYMDIMKLLLSYGANLNAKNENGYTVASFVQPNTLKDLKSVRVKRRCFPNCFIEPDQTELKDVSGAVLTRLPRGAVVREVNEDNGYAWVVVGKNLSGWVDASALGPAKPDMFAPIIRVLSKSLDGGKLFIKGVVYSDKPLKSLVFGSKDIYRADFHVPKGNYKNSYPFKASMTMIPGAKAVLVAEDFEGLKAQLKVDVKTPVLDYTPQYAQLKVVHSASVFSSPISGAKVLTKVLNQSVIVSIGRKADWYYLEGGGWILASDVSEIAQSSMSNSPESVELNASPAASGPKVLSEPSYVDVDIPFGVPNPNAIAVIIANRDYRTGVPPVEFALNDGRVMKKYFRRLFGVRESNLIYQENAGKGDFEALFGTADNYKGKLYNYVYGLGNKPDVFIYYVGHGAPAENKKAYLVPVDADPEYVGLEGYPLDTLYANLRRLGAHSVTVILDACFSGQSPNGTLIKNASPLITRMSLPVIPKGFSLLSAAGPDQMASWDTRERHSLFTYYLMKGLKNRAHFKTLSVVTVGDIKGYVRDRVERAARKLYNRDQTPQFDGSLQDILARYAK